MAKILIIEDNAVNMRLAQAVLKNAGHQTFQAERAEAGRDDYIAKPVHYQEVGARIAALLGEGK